MVGKGDEQYQRKGCIFEIFIEVQYALSELSYT